MTNWIIIFNTQVIAVIEKDGNIDDTDLTASWDTVTEDASKIFKVGDTFTNELDAQYNRNTWLERGWISDTVTTPIKLHIPHASVSEEVL
jgi:hypothetical protein